MPQISKHLFTRHRVCTYKWATRIQRPLNLLGTSIRSSQRSATTFHSINRMATASLESIWPSCGRQIMDKTIKYIRKMSMATLSRKKAVTESDCISLGICNIKSINWGDDLTSKIQRNMSHCLYLSNGPRLNSISTTSRTCTVARTDIAYISHSYNVNCSWMWIEYLAEIRYSHGGRPPLDHATIS